MKIEDVFGKVSPPPQVKNLTDKGGGGGISFLLNTVVELIFVASIISVVFMFLIAAFQMITSGGDKEAVAGARKRITYAIVGIVLLALTFFILRFLGDIIGIRFISR